LTYIKEINAIDFRPHRYVILDSERSDECIDFTMMCVFFLCTYSITSRNNAPISNYEGEIKSKHFPTVFKKIKKNKKKKKMTEKR
ncbi:Uncharacterized protein FWK35_00007316, partial [Aphis craccivora]